jgi:hypothetical protein
VLPRCPKQAAEPGSAHHRNPVSGHEASNLFVKGSPRRARPQLCIAQKALLRRSRHPL